MKVLIIQENGRHEANRRYRECFCLQRAFLAQNHQADVWGLGHADFGSISPDQYDLIFVLENYDENGWLPDLSSCKSFKVLWAIDEHCRGTKYYERLYERNRMQLMLHSTKEYVKESRGDLWFPNCYDDTLIKPLDVPKRADVGFCGNVLNRSDKLDLLKKHFNFVADIFVIGDAMVAAINSYRISFNSNISNDINYRSFETIGCGVPLVTNYNPQYPLLGFEHGINCMMYHDDAEMLKCISTLLSDKDLCNNIGKAGLRLAARHTYDQRVDRLVHLISTARTL